MTETTTKKIKPKTSALFAKFATDSDREEAGIWVNFGEGIKVKVRRLKSRKSQEYRKELDKPYTNEIRRGALDDKTAEDLLIRQIGGGVVADWSGVEDEDGTPLPYTAENAIRLLRLLPEFRDAIFAVSVDADAFKKHIGAEAEKN